MWVVVMGVVSVMVGEVWHNSNRGQQFCEIAGPAPTWPEGLVDMGATHPHVLTQCPETVAGRHGYDWIVVAVVVQAGRAGEVEPPQEWRLASAL